MIPSFRDEVDALAKRLKLKLFRVSVKEGFNVEQGNVELCDNHIMWFHNHIVCCFYLQYLTTWL